MSDQRRVHLFQSHHNHLGYLPRAEGVEVGVVGQRLGLVGERVGSIVHQGFLGAFLAQRLEERRRHRVQVDDGHALALGHRLHGLGVFAVRVAHRAMVVIEQAACRRCDKDDVSAFLAHTVGKYLQVSCVAVPCAVAGTLLFLVVMAELADDIVTLAQLRQYLVQPQLGQKRRGRQSTLSVVGHHDAVVHPPGKHLSPRRPRLVLLVHHGTVAAEEHRRCRSVRLNTYALDGRRRSAEGQRQRVVPIFVPHLAGLQLDTALAVDARGMLVDHEGHRFVAPFLRRHHVGVVAAALRPDHGLGSTTLRAQRNGHAVVAVGHWHAVAEGLVAGTVERHGQGFHLLIDACCREGGKETLVLVACYLHDGAVTRCEVALGLGVLHKGEVAQVVAPGELVVVVAVAVVHQTPAAADERKHARSFHVALRRLAEAVQKRPRLRAVQVFYQILAYAFVLAVGLGLEEEVQLSLAVLHDVGVDGWCTEVKQHLRLRLQGAEVVVSVAPVDAVVGYAAVVGQQREVHHIFAGFLVVERLRCPYAGDIGKRRTGEALGEVYRVVLPVYEVARPHEHQSAVAVPALPTAHVSDRHAEPAVAASQNVGVAHAFGPRNGVAANDGLSAVQRGVVEAVVAHGIADLFFLRGIARKVDEKVVGGRQDQC